MTTNVESRCEQLADYCAVCAAVSGCSRHDAIVEPDEIEWTGWAVTARYRCCCGHTWTCNWSAAAAGINTNSEGRL